MQSVKRTHFHRISNGFSLKSVVTAVKDRNFTPRTTIICITVLYFPHNCTLFSIQHPCYCMENTVHFVPLIRPRKVQYMYITLLCVCVCQCVYIFKCGMLSILVAAQEDPGVVIAYPGQDVEIPCSIPQGSGFTLWMINGISYTPNDLLSGNVVGHNVSGRNIIVEDIVMNDVRNGTEYRCIVAQIDVTIVSDPIFLFVAGEVLSKLDLY